MRKIYGMRAILIAGLTLVSTGRAEKSQYSDVNRDLFVFPRAQSMALSDLVYSRDASPMSNPAVSALEPGARLEATYAGYHGNLFSISGGSYTTRIDDLHGIGLFFGYLHNPDIPFNAHMAADADGYPQDYSEEDVIVTSASELRLGASYSRRFVVTPHINISMGVAANGLRIRLPGWDSRKSQINNIHGYGLGIDAGAVFDHMLSGVRAGINFDGLATYNYWGKYDEYQAPRLRIGVGYRKEIPYVYGRVLAVASTADLLGNDGARLSKSFRSDYDSETWTEHQGVLSAVRFGHVGFEYTIFDVVALRLGYHSGYASFGGGVSLFEKIMNFNVSYIVTDLGGSYTVSMATEW